MQYEVHLTIDPVFLPARLETLEMLAREWRFAVARLYKMDNEPSRKDSFMTGRFATLQEAFDFGNGLRELCETAGFPVRRFKIEQILYDRRF